MQSIRQTHRRAPWHVSHRRGFHALYIVSGVAVLVSIGAFAMLARQLGSPTLAVQHIAAAAGCETAQDVGVSLARRGEAGYYGHQDVDHDGIACNSLADKFGSQELARRHLAAAASCATARAQGLAPAYRGMPGYYESHDADADGVACEPYR